MYVQKAVTLKGLFNYKKVCQRIIIKLCTNLTHQNTNTSGSETAGLKCADAKNCWKLCVTGALLEQWEGLTGSWRFCRGWMSTMQKNVSFTKLKKKLAVKHSKQGCLGKTWALKSNLPDSSVELLSSSFPQASL